MSNIAVLIQQLSGVENEDKVRLFKATVNSVDLDKRVCSVTTTTGNATLDFDAQLMAGVADGLLMQPKINSTVFILMSKYTLPFVIQYSDIESYALNGNEFGGVAKVIELTQKINDLEQKINELIVWGATVTPPLTTSAMVLTQQAEIENTTVAHGS